MFVCVRCSLFRCICPSSISHMGGGGIAGRRRPTNKEFSEVGWSRASALACVLLNIVLFHKIPTNFNLGIVYISRLEPTSSDDSPHLQIYHTINTRFTVCGGSINGSRSLVERTGQTPRKAQWHECASNQMPPPQRLKHWKCRPRLPRIKYSEAHTIIAK